MIHSMKVIKRFPSVTAEPRNQHGDSLPRSERLQTIVKYCTPKTQYREPLI